MDRIINKIVKLFKKKYFIITFIFVFVIMILGSTYSFWSYEAGWKLASELQFKNLYYSFTINGVTTSTISSGAASGTVYYNVSITSLNDLNTKYLLSYTSTNPAAEVKISSVSTNDSSGIIGKYDGGSGVGRTKVVRIAVTNNSASAATITLSVDGGYSWNPVTAITLKDNYSIVSLVKKEVTVGLGQTLAQTVNAILSCTPTASSPCLYSNNSNNYVNFGGYYWRILGSYIVGGENVVKIILDEPIATKSTYSGLASSLSTFYGTLTDTGLIKTSAPFNCTGTSTITCTGSDNIGLISKSEYDLIGNENSYLYAKPKFSYWTNTESESGIYNIATNRGSSTLAGSSEAYVKPVLYLNHNIVTSSTSDGTYNNPYVTKYGYSLTVNKNSGTADLNSGYYSSDYTYSFTLPTRTNHVVRDYVTTGTGTSISNNVLTMGATDSTVTIRWWYTYTIAYNCNGGAGSPQSITHIEDNAMNLSPSVCYKVTAGTSGNILNIAGWDTSSSGTTVVYNDQGSVVNLTTTPGATVTLYAVWGTNYIFSYSGSYNVIDDTGGNWRIKFLTSGNLIRYSGTFSIDVFIVGGGGGGGSGTAAGSGGGGGYTGTWTTSLTNNQSYPIVIGGGGGPNSAGGTSSAFGYSKNGGSPGTGAGAYKYYGTTGGAGGSGGGGNGANYTSYFDAGNGGSNGSNGYAGGSNAPGGAGQGSSTEEFGISGATKYGPGGGGGCYLYTKNAGIGGATGGGNGYGTIGGGSYVATSGTANTGGGGGGSSYGGGGGTGSGGSGIVVIKRH